MSRQVAAAVLPEELPAAAARHERLAVGADAEDGDEPAAAGRVQRRDQPALGAEADAVGGVLDVAAGDDPAVVDQRRDAHLEPE